jgi:hypothetical protein
MRGSAQPASEEPFLAALRAACQGELSSPVDPLESERAVSLGLKAAKGIRFHRPSVQAALA